MTPTLNILDSQPRADGIRQVRSESSAKDRDGDGRRSRDEQPRKLKLTDEEIEKALQALKNLEGVQANDLIVEIEVQGEIRVAMIKDINGNVVRRIPESELWSLVTRSETEPEKGSLLNRTG